MTQYVYEPFNAATDGAINGDPFCLAIDGFLCPRPRVIVSPAPAPVEALDRRRQLRDIKDISDLIDIIGNMLMRR